jgi:hypothetical protein
MRLRLFRGRLWWPGRRRGRRAAGRAPRTPDAPALSQTAGREPGQPSRAPGQPGSHRKAAAGGVGWPSNIGRRSQAPADQVGASSRAQPARTTAGASVTGASSNGANRAAARAAIKAAPGTSGSAPAAGTANTTRSAPSARHAVSVRPRAASRAAEPWYAVARPARPDAGFRHCGRLEEVLVREWQTETGPAPECVTAVNRLAELPLLIKEKLAAGLEAIHIGSGGVPDLDDMGDLSGVPLPSGRATWDACAGAYGDRKIIVGSRPSPTPDVMCHEVGHALDDLDGPDGGWQSDAADFRALYGRCQPHLATEFHQHGGTLGRREFFADAFAAIASGQRPALVEMLGGDTRTALDVMLYFNVRYGM